jgi:hypothetical protein
MKEWHYFIGFPLSAYLAMKYACSNLYVGCIAAVMGDIIAEYA